MSRAGDEEDDDESFYESLDRVLSSISSSSSTSSSAEDEEDERDPNSSSDSPSFVTDCPVSIPRFPIGVSNNYDVWISEPSSVEERRLRLLCRMGLSRDLILSRRKTSLFDDGGGSTYHGDFGRSVSSDQLSHCRQSGEVSCSYSSPVIVRSKSDGATDHHRECSPRDRCISNSSADSPPSLLITSNSLSGNQTGGPFVNKHSDLLKSRSGNGSPNTGAASLNKPPTGKNSRRMDEIRNDSRNLIMNVDSESCATVEHAASREFDVSDRDAVSGVCTIKDLDNGKEFVVNEVREDGMWNKLKEVGTGRQLTMEEFETCVGLSPIVQELMRRQNVEDGNRDNLDPIVNGSAGNGSKLRKKGSWLKSIRHVASTMTGYKERSSDERGTSSDKGGRRSSSATDDSQDASFHGPERVRVRQYGKSCKELTGLYKNQEIQAHNGSIWTIKFSLDGKFLASAGEDCVIHVWQVVESERKGDLLIDKFEDGNLNFLFLTNGSPEPSSTSPKFEGSTDKKRRGRSSVSRKSVSLDHIVVPETIFGLSDKPVCSFQGHLDDVLDLSWSKSQHLLSSSMDKTVRLWHLSTKSCLKIFSHSDYVTCIQFNPVDDRYFISGSLDAKVRIWSVPDCQVVDWSDLHEMVTAACYTPDGQGALVGSHKGCCHLYNTSENKLQQKGEINLQNKKKKSHHKKITGFQFVPGSSSEVLVTSADSRIRVIDGVDLVHKFKGFRNTNSQISASLTANVRFVVCASEDSHVYVWKHEEESRPSRSKGITISRSYEHFHCQDVAVAIPWPGMSDSWVFQDTCLVEHNSYADQLEEVSTANHPPTPVEELNGNESSLLASACTGSPFNGIISSASNNYFFDRILATWPEEKLPLAAKKHSPHVSVDFSDGLSQNRSAWGMVIVTAGLRGEIRTYQNFGLPVQI